MTVHRQRRLGVAAATGALLAFASADARADEVLRVSGTGSALGAMQRLSVVFERANPGFRVQILPSVGSSGAIAAVAKGALDVGISGRPLDAGEQALGLTATAYARTPLLFAVGPRTGVSGITTHELIRIYRGEVTTWPNGERIRLVIRPRKDVDNALLRAISPEMAAAVDIASDRKGLLLAITNQECDEILAHTAGAIGPTSLSQVLTVAETLVPLTWNGVAPTVSNLASGAYPLAKTHFFVTRASPSPPVRRLIAFLTSPEAREVLEQTGNLPTPMPPQADTDAKGRR